MEGGRSPRPTPGDDDATLFLFKKYVDTYGWEWLEALARQDVHFHRGTNTPGEAVDAGLKRVGLAGAASGGAGTTWSTPDAGHPSSPGASARHCSGTPLHPEAAKSYPN
ncbi:hypothetical protein [Streptomyces sp. KL116D]|uniref:hypothetical protein n=1 Tax=Streptomyces sp. KL116D TaxID=3045152 RepID=UPI003556161A